MSGNITIADEIYIVCGYTDMRRAIDGLCAIVQDRLHMDPKCSALYLFCGKRCDRIKALLWEGDSFIVVVVYNYRIAYFVEVFLYQLAQQVNLNDEEYIYLGCVEDNFDNLL